MLKWICQRVEGRGAAVATPIGNVPAPGAIDTTGLNIPAADLQELLRVDLEGWKREIEDVAKSYEKLGTRLPAALAKQLENLRARLNQA